MELIETIFKIIPIVGKTIFYTVTAALLTFYFLKRNFSEFFQEKSKNLATKQDIEEITEKIKKVEHKYESQLENLKANLDERKYLRQYNYDKEFLAYTEIMEHIAVMKQISVAMCFDFEDLVGEKYNVNINELRYIRKTENEKIQNFEKTLNEFHAAVNKYKPFYKKEIYDILNRTYHQADFSLLRYKAIGAIRSGPKNLKLNHERVESMLNIVENLDLCTNMICTRFHELVSLNNGNSL